MARRACMCGGEQPRDSSSFDLFVGTKNTSVVPSQQSTVGVSVSTRVLL